jgi:hypothetical protein
MFDSIDEELEFRARQREMGVDPTELEVSKDPLYDEIRRINSEAQEAADELWERSDPEWVEVFEAYAKPRVEEAKAAGERRLAELKAAQEKEDYLKLLRIATPDELALIAAQQRLAETEEKSNEKLYPVFPLTGEEKSRLEHLRRYGEAKTLVPVWGRPKTGPDTKAAVAQRKYVRNMKYRAAGLSYEIGERQQIEKRIKAYHDAAEDTLAAVKRARLDLRLGDKDLMTLAEARMMVAWISSRRS